MIVYPPVLGVTRIDLAIEYDSTKYIFNPLA
jgi:hypothetical protein